MKNAQTKEGQFARRWLKLQKQAENSRRTEQLAKILREMSELLTEMERKTAPPKTPLAA